ncbi:hypothetical protein GN956_G17610 [Arapaima gigas]
MSLENEERENQVETQQHLRQKLVKSLQLIPEGFLSEAGPRSALPDKGLDSIPLVSTKSRHRLTSFFGDVIFFRA